MKTKKAKTGKTVKTQAKPIDEKTGYREGSLGYAVGRAYLGESKHEKAIEAVEEVIRSAMKAKGKPTNEDYVHGRAISWVGFLKTRDSKIYADLPKTEKPAAVKAPKAKTVKAKAKKAVKSAKTEPVAEREPALA